MSGKESTMRIRKAEFSGAEDKFYAPSDDIRNCARGIIKGALEAALENAPHEKEGLLVCAEALAKFHQDAFLSEEKVPEIMGHLIEGLNGSGCGMGCLANIGKAMLTYYAVAQRETSGHKDATNKNIERISAIGSILGGLTPEDRASVTRILTRNRIYPEELGREAQEGLIFEG